MSELKPCPFCGAQPNSPYTDQIEYDTWTAYIDCSGCDIQVTDQYGKKSPEMAIIAVQTLWNCRAAPQEQK